MSISKGVVDALVSMLTRHAKERGMWGSIESNHAKRCADFDPRLSSLMVKVSDAQKELDTYILARTEDAHKGDVR
jgi:hypothetical protein